MKRAKAGLKLLALFVSLDRIAVLTGLLELFPLLSPRTTNLNVEAAGIVVDSVVVVV